MGLIAVTSLTGRNKMVLRQAAIKRLSRVSAKASVRSLGLPIQEYTKPGKSSLCLVVIKELRQLKPPVNFSLASKLDLIWMSRRLNFSRHSWSAFMQHVSTGEHNGKSNVMFLPIVDLNPSDDNCIYSTLCFIVTQAKLLNVHTPCITFDQPLWIKAVEISRSSSMNVFCRLGGFHMLMSYLGSTGMVMAGSGLEEVLELCYGPNTVTQMMSGKAVSRALRGYILVDAALNAVALQMLSSNTCKELNIDCELLTSDVINEVTVLYERLMDNSDEDAVNAVLSSEAVNTIDSVLRKFKAQLTSRSRTAKLWLQFMNNIETVRLFIRAERLSDWSMHQLATQRMLSLFAASGHFNYAKCARLYLQMMQDMPETHPWLYEQFACHGLQSVRRSDRQWAGIWTDLAIEQILMRSLKTRGGLTRGRGFTESVHLTWVYTMHRCASVHQAMMALTGLYNSTGDEHVEMGKSRVSGDTKDLEKMIAWFECHNPFLIRNAALSSLSTGLSTEDAEVNCDEAESIGVRSEERRVGKECRSRWS